MNAALDGMINGVCAKNSVNEIYVATEIIGKGSTKRYNLQAVPSSGDVLLVSSVVRTEKRDQRSNLPRVDIIIIVRPPDSTTNNDGAEISDLTLQQIRSALARKITGDRHGQVKGIVVGPLLSLVH